jgi:hypothetical protein
VCFCLIAVDQHDGHIDYNQICQAYGSRNACLLVVVVVVAAEVVVVAAAEVVVVVLLFLSIFSFGPFELSIHLTS